MPARRMETEHLRQYVRDMTSAKAVEYLLWQIENLSQALGFEAPHPVDDWNVHLTPAERRMVVRLYDAEGKVCSMKCVHAAIGKAGADGETDPAVVRVIIRRLRLKIPASVCAITNYRERGYALHLAQR